VHKNAQSCPTGSAQPALHPRSCKVSRSF
jgi:hypothetical protein